MLSLDFSPYLSSSNRKNILSELPKDSTSLHRLIEKVHRDQCLADNGDNSPMDIEPSLGSTGGPVVTLPPSHSTENPEEKGLDLILERGCLDDEFFELILTFEIDQIYLQQCTFQPNSRMESTMYFLQHYQTNPGNFEFLVSTGSSTTQWFFEGDLNSNDFDSSNPANVLVIILPCTSLEDIDLASLSCIVVQPSETEVAPQQLSAESWDDLISILGLSFQKPLHFILKDLCIDNQIMDELRKLDSELIHFSNCSYYSTKYPNNGSISDQSEPWGQVIPMVDETWFVLSENLPPEYCFNRDSAMKFLVDKNKQKESIPWDSLPVFDAILGKRFLDLREVILQDLPINEERFSFIQTLNVDILDLRNCTLEDRNTVWDIFCELNQSQLTIDVLEFFHWVESFPDYSQLDSPSSPPLNGPQYPRRLDALCLQLPGKSHFRFHSKAVSCLVIHSPTTENFLGALDAESMKSLESILKHFKRFGNLMLKDFLVTQELMDLIMPSQPSSLALENCRFRDDSLLNFSKLRSLRGLRVVQSMPQLVDIDLPWFLKELRIDCSGPKQETWPARSRLKYFTFDASYCAVLKSV
jgi:hypothetical protein